MFGRLKFRGVAIGLLLMAAVPMVQAQEIASSFDQLRVLVKPGDTVSVTETSGLQITGKIASLSSSSLEVMTRGRRTALAQDEVSTVSRQRHGDLATGAKWGFGIGAASGGLLSALGCGLEYSGSECAALIPLAAAVWGGIGSGIGVGISSLRTSQHVIYGKPGSPNARLGVSPLVTRERKGLFVSLGF